MIKTPHSLLRQLLMIMMQDQKLMFSNYIASAFYWTHKNKVHFETISEGEDFIPFIFQSVYCYRNIILIIKWVILLPLLPSDQGINPCLCEVATVFNIYHILISLTQASVYIFHLSVCHHKSVLQWHRDVKKSFGFHVLQFKAADE